MKVLKASMPLLVVFMAACGSEGKVGDACTTADDCEDGLECHVDEHEEHDDHEDEDHEDEGHEDEDHEDEGGTCEEADAHDHD